MQSVIKVLGGRRGSIFKSIGLIFGDGPDDLGMIV